jgi:hypothetical protein
MTTVMLGSLGYLWLALVAGGTFDPTPSEGEAKPNPAAGAAEPAPVVPTYSPPIAGVLRDSPTNDRPRWRDNLAYDFPFPGTEFCGGRLLASFDYQLGLMKHAPLPEPLVTTGTLGGFGALDQPGTGILYGDQSANFGTFAGGRVRALYWGDDARTWGVEANGFVWEQRAETFSVNSDALGNPIIARPVVNAATGLEAAAVITAPGFLSGGVHVAQTSQIWGSEANLLWKVREAGWQRWYLLGGIRYLDLDERLDIQDRSTVLFPGSVNFQGVPLGTASMVTSLDRFATRNQFLGAQFGAKVERNVPDFTGLGDCAVEIFGKVALGSTWQTSQVTGTTAHYLAGGLAGIAPGGLLAVASNGGKRTTNEFGVVPELGVNLRYPIAPYITLDVGYSLLFWLDVLRPGQQIDRVIDPCQVPRSIAACGPLGPTSPAPVHRTSDFWIQSFSFGLSYRF